jgi:hypothetical protein
LSGLARPGVPDHSVTYRSALRNSISLPTQHRSRSPGTPCLGTRPARVLSNHAPTPGSAALSCARRLGPVLRCPGAANHHDPVMTPYLPRSIPAPGPGAAACPGSPCRWSLRRRHGVRRPQVAQAPRFAPRQRRVLLPYRSSHTRSWFAAYDTRLGPAAGIPGPAGLDNHRNPVTTSYHPGGEPGHTLIDTQIDGKIHEFNRRIGWPPGSHSWRTAGLHLRSRRVRAPTITLTSPKGNP